MKLHAGNAVSDHGAKKNRDGKKRGGTLFLNDVSFKNDRRWIVPLLE